MARSTLSVTRSGVGSATDRLPNLLSSPGSPADLLNKMRAKDCSVVFACFPEDAEMKLTPWMLSLATFSMVGAMAVSYIARGSGTDSPRNDASISAEPRSAPRPFVQSDDPRSALKTPPTPPPERSKPGTVAEPEPLPQQPETATQAAVAKSPPTPAKLPDVESPQLPGESNRSTLQPTFITEHYRRGGRSVARFDGNERIGDPIAQDLTPRSAGNEATARTL